MFSSFTSRLTREVQTLKLVLDTHDSMRDLIFRAETTPDGTDEPTARPDSDTERAVGGIRKTAPSKLPWQVYDHCAAFTRLYAVYEQFIDDLVREYLRMLPKLYSRYEELPARVTTQHRVGIGQILFKLGKDGPYKELEERTVIKDLAHGLLGNSDYILLPDAFLIDPQNYRAEALIKLFSYVGFEDCWAWIEKHPLVVAFMQGRRDPENETPKTLLRDFVENRNLASHTLIGGTVATEEIKSIADFVLVLGDVLAQLVMKQVVQRKKAIGEAAAVGAVLHKFSDQIVGVKMSAGRIAVGDTLAVVQKRTCYNAAVSSIRIQQATHERLDVREGEEIGLRLTAPAGDGAQLLRLVPESQPLPAVTLEPLSPDDFPVEAEESTGVDIDSQAGTQSVT
jgi:hypothetical protein